MWLCLVPCSRIQGPESPGDAHWIPIFAYIVPLLPHLCEWVFSLHPTVGNYNPGTGFLCRGKVVQYGTTSKERMIFEPQLNGRIKVKKKKSHRAGKRVHQPHEPGNLSSVPGAHIKVEGEIGSTKFSSGLHMCPVTYIYTPPTHTTINSCLLKIKISQHNSVT